MLLQHHCFGSKYCISCKEWRSHWADTKNFLFLPPFSPLLHHCHQIFLFFCDFSLFSFASIGQTCFPVFSCRSTSKRLKCQHWPNCLLFNTAIYRILSAQLLPAINLFANIFPRQPPTCTLSRVIFKTRGLNISEITFENYYNQANYVSA